MVFNRLIFISCACIAASSMAFAPVAPRTSNNNYNRVEFRPKALQATESDASVSAFDAYDLTDPTQAVAMTDTLVGSGDVAEEGSYVTVAYTGTLLESGKQFDTSAEGISFKLGEGLVIPGWETGMIGMRVGGKRTMRIPPSAAYGDKGAGKAIPPGSHVQFEVELIKVASNPVEEFLATRDFELPYLTMAIVAAAVGMKVFS